MTKVKQSIDEKIANISNDIRNQFIKAGEDVGRNIIDNFNDILQKDVKELQSRVDMQVRDNTLKLQKKLQSDLKKAIVQEFGDSIFGQQLQSSLLSSIFDSGSGSISTISNFKESRSQSLVGVGRSITRSSNRNG